MWLFGIIQRGALSQFGAGMNMMVVCWIGRGFSETAIWIMRTPEQVSREWLRYFALMHAVGILAEIGTNALFAHFIGDEIGSHAIWISSFAYYVYHLVQWPFEKRDEQGRLPKLGKYVLVNLVFPIVLCPLPIGCVRREEIAIVVLVTLVVVLDTPL